MWLSLWTILSASCVLVIAQTSATDWTDLTTGLTPGSTISLGGSIGVPSQMVLTGSAFPVVISADGSHALMAGARVSSGRVFAWNKENYYTAVCTTAGTLCNGPLGQLLVNALRWAGGKPVPAAAIVTVRLAAHSSVGNSAYFTNLNQSAALKGVKFVPPGTQSSYILSNVASLGSGASAIADVYLTTSYVSYTAADRDSILNFVRAGGGVALGGQAWSSSDVTTYGGNVLLAPLNVVVWTPEYGEWYPTTIKVPSAAPATLSYNADAAANAVLAHLNGVSLLPAATLSSATAALTKALSISTRAMFAPTAPSLSLWALFDSTLAQRLNGQAQQWTCGSVPSSNPLNQLTVAYYSKMQQDASASQVTPLPCSNTFPGAPAVGAVPVTSTVAVNATYAGNYTGPMPPRGGTKWLSTGLWAPVGQVVTFTISSALAATLKATGGPLGMQIGSHSDNISGKTTWCRQPYGMVQRFYFNSLSGGSTITAASGVGGLIYVLADWGNTLGPVQVTISGAIKAPFYFRGQTTEADWRASIRNHPAPWAEIGSDKLVMTVPSSVVAQLDNPEAIMVMWDAVMDAMADLSAFSRDRPRAERMVADCDISAGWMHSGYPIMMYTVSAPDLFTNYYGESSESSKWGPFHELGHNHQFYSDLPNTGETTTNIFTVYAMELVMKINRTVAHPALANSRATARANYMASGQFSTDWTVWVALDTYLQLLENIAGDYLGGWDFYKRVLARYLTLEGTPGVANDAAKIQTWIIETSKIAGKSLVPFYRDWKFPIDPATETALSGLPAWTFNAKQACGQTCVQCCLPASMSYQPPLPPPRPPRAPTTPTQDWYDIMSGLAGVNISMQGIGIQTAFSLSGAAFPLFSSPSPWVAGPVGLGRVVAMGKENNIYAACGSSDTTLCNGPSGKLIINTLRWAASYLAGSSSTNISIRVAADSSAASATFFTNLNSAASAVGISIIPPSGKRTFFLNAADLLNIASGNNALLDAYITTAYVEYTQQQRDALAAFVTAGGGLLIGGQTWYKYTAADVGTYPGNVLMAQLNANISWTASTGAYDPAWLVAPTDPLHFLTAVITPGNGLQLGNSKWRTYKQCNEQSWMAGLRTRVLANQSAGDDSGLNALTGRCRTNAGSLTNDLQAENGYTGSWSGYVMCPTGAFVTAISMRVQPYTGALSSPFNNANDQVAASALRARCSDGTILTPSNAAAAAFGSWGPFVSCPLAFGAPTAVCGLNVLTQTYSSTVDFTALNDVRVQCCLKW